MIVYYRGRSSTINGSNYQLYNDTLISKCLKQVQCILECTIAVQNYATHLVCPSHPCMPYYAPSISPSMPSRDRGHTAPYAPYQCQWELVGCAHGLHRWKRCGCVQYHILNGVVLTCSACSKGVHYHWCVSRLFGVHVPDEHTWIVCGLYTNCYRCPPWRSRIFFGCRCGHDWA